MKKLIALIIIFSLASQYALASVNQPIKAPWLSREDTIALYNQQIAEETKQNEGSSSGESAGKKPVDYIMNPAVMQINLDKNAGVHPRLYFDAQGFLELKEKVKSPEYAVLYEKSVANAERLYGLPIMEYNPNDGAMDDNQRVIGDNIAPLAFQYKITDDRKYFEKALEWSLAACQKFPKWGINNDDLAAGHILYSLGLFYDWCYDDITPEDRAILRKTMVDRGSNLNSYGTTNPKTWATSFLQNHSWINLCGLATAGLAIYDEEKAVRPWFDTATKGYSTALLLLGDDGANHEGVGYWAYGVEWLTRYLDLSREFFGVDGYQSEFFKSTILYRIYTGLPRASWTPAGKVTYDYGDANGKDYSSASAILQRLADEYDDGYAQWYANELINSPLNFDAFVWRNIMNFNPDIEMKSIDELPTIKEFEDFGFVMARSSWSGNESYIGFRNGPALGKYATALINEKRLSHGVGDMAHVHPDNNHFILFANGEMLLRDDGYVSKFTNSHNTLLVGGEGQAGEGLMWFNNNGGGGIDSEVFENDAAITKVVTRESYDYFVADAAKSYKLSAGVKKFNRHMIYLKDDDILIVADDIKLSRAKPLELRFFTESQQLTMEENTVKALSHKNNFEIELLTPENAEMLIDPVRIARDRYNNQMDRKAVQIKTNQTEWQNAVALKWSYPNIETEKVTYEADGQSMIFKVSDKTITLNLNTNNIKVTEQSEIRDADATLKNIAINNNPINNFAPNSFNLEYNLDDYAKLIETKLSDYKVLAMPTGKYSTVEVALPEAVPGVLTIKVTSRDKTRENTYRINMTGTIVSANKIPIVATRTTGNATETLPEMAYDNDYGTYWTDEGDGKYIELDIGAVRELAGISVAWHKGAERQSRYSIEVSEDQTSWAEILSGASSGTSLESEFYEFPAGQKARYIRIIGHGNTEGSFWHSISEAAVYEISR